MYRPYFDMSRGVLGLPGKNKSNSLHKTECCNVLSDLTAIFAVDRRCGGSLDKIRNFETMWIFFWEIGKSCVRASVITDVFLFFF